LANFSFNTEVDKVWLRSLKIVENKKSNIKYEQSIGMADLAKAFIVHPRDPGSNLGSDKKYILFVSHLNPNL
jgi:hypothetical protein